MYGQVAVVAMITNGSSKTSGSGEPVAKYLLSLDSIPAECVNHLSPKMFPFDIYFKPLLTIITVLSN